MGNQNVFLSVNRMEKSKNGIKGERKSATLFGHLVGNKIPQAWLERVCSPLREERPFVLLERNGIHFKDVSDYEPSYVLAKYP